TAAARSSRASRTKWRRTCALYRTLVAEKSRYLQLYHDVFVAAIVEVPAVDAGEGCTQGTGFAAVLVDLVEHHRAGRLAHTLGMTVEFRRQQGRIRHGHAPLVDHHVPFPHHDLVLQRIACSQG